MKYLVVYEGSPTSWGAYVPDLPGLGVVATTLREAKELIREAVEFHVEGLREHGDPIPHQRQRPNILVWSRQPTERLL